MEKLAIIGCGTMGHSIALNAAMAELPVKMYGIDEGDIARGKAGILKNLTTLSDHGFMDTDKALIISSKIITTTSINEVIEDSTYVIEAIPEDLNLKMNFFQNLDKLCNEDIILASNTSGLSPTAIASLTKNAQRTIVTHFWNPAHLVPLVEVVRGKETNDITVSRTFELLKIMKKKPIEVKKEVPGFVANRLQLALFREALFLYEQGIASKEDIDKAVVYSIGRRLCMTGPLVSADMGGLDVFSSISDYLFSDLCNTNASFTSIKDLVKDNKLGSKSGQGFYNWDKAFTEKMNNKRDAELIRFLKLD